MLVEKEIIAPGTYWYKDEKSEVPRKLVVTPELTSYWHDQGSKMLGFGLTVPVPYEHDFNAHPMTPKDKLLNNAGEVKEYRLRDFTDPKRGKVTNALFGVVDVQDPDAQRKIGHSIRWTSPWINSFTDGDGRKWNNVISHLALTTRPRITKQEPFSSIAAALSMASEVWHTHTGRPKLNEDAAGKAGFCLSKAGLLYLDERKYLRPWYPVAFSMWGGIKLGDDDAPPKKKKGKKAPPKGPPTEIDDEGEEGEEDDEGLEGLEGLDELDPAGGEPPPGGPPGAPPPGGPPGAAPPGGPPGADTPGGPPTPGAPGGMNKFADAAGDVGMEELLCDLLAALGIHLPEATNEVQFKRALYEAAMMKIHELAAKGQAGAQPPPGGDPNNPKPPGAPGAAPGGNPILQQEQQPMYMSLDDINKIDNPTMKTIALSMYNENIKLRAEMEGNAKVATSLRDAKLKEANATRATRVAMLSRVSPKVKTDLEAMLALPAMALSLGDGGEVIDPLGPTLMVLEKGLADIPRLLTTDSASLSTVPQPTDADTLKQEEIDMLADNMSRMMGYPVPAKAG